MRRGVADHGYVGEALTGAPCLVCGGPFSDHGQEPKAATPFIDTNPNQPTPDQLYLAGVVDPDLSPAAIVKLNKAHGRRYVTEALRQLRGFPPEAEVGSTYAWLDTVAAFKRAAGTL